VAGTANTAADSDPDFEKDSGLPPCQAAARDPEGSFILAAAEGVAGQCVRHKVVLAGNVMDVVCVLCQVAQLSGLAS
jgi:hypothetical protein